MVIAQIKKIRLNSTAGARLSFDAYTDAQKYISRLNVEHQFKMVVAEDAARAVTAMVEMLKAELLPSWLTYKGVTPSDFTIQLAFSGVDEKGFFWKIDTPTSTEYPVT